MNIQLILVLANLFSLGYGLNCFQCQGDDKQCLNVNDGKGLPTAQCNKLTYFGPFPENFWPGDIYKKQPMDNTTAYEEIAYFCMRFGTKAYAYRSCVRESEGYLEEFCLSLMASGLDGIYCTYCNTLKCNSSAGLTPPLIFIILILALQLRNVRI